MYCENCPTIISDALSKLTGVKNAQISYKDSSAQIELLMQSEDENEISRPLLQDIKETINELGYIG